MGAIRPQSCFACGRESHSNFAERGMISRGNKRRGNKRTKHRASNSDQAPRPETPLSGLQRFAEDARQKRRAWLRRPQIHPSTFEEPLENEVETAEEVAERARKQNELAKKLRWESRGSSRLFLDMKKIQLSQTICRSGVTFPRWKSKSGFLVE